MNIEQTQHDTRLAKFEALADHARLRIVDLLAAGDHTPTEVQTRFGISSSLLAHHLNLLERAGLVTRHRSEADRRRTYLSLTADAFDGLLVRPHLDARRVVFVCTGNSARSQLAAALWHASSPVPVDSAGTHPAAAIADGAIASARRHGLQLGSRRPRSLSSVLADDDFVITVCDRAHEELGRVGQLHWSIPDPVRNGTDAAFEAAYAEIAERVDELVPRVVARAS